MQPGFVLHGFARNKMFFRVAQEGSLKKSAKKIAAGEPAADDSGGRGLPNAIRRKTEEAGTKLVALTGIEPVF